MSTPKLGKKFQDSDYKVDMLANKLNEEENRDDDYYDEEGYDQPYNIDVSRLL